MPVPHSAMASAMPRLLSKRALIALVQTVGRRNMLPTASSAHSAHHEAMSAVAVDSRARQPQKIGMPASAIRRGPSRSVAMPVSGAANSAIIEMMEIPAGNFRSRPAEFPLQRRDHHAERIAVNRA